MNKQWRAGLLARFGHDPYPFSVIVEGKDKNEAIKYISKHYPNASIVEIEEDVDDLNMDDLYRDLKGVSPVDETSEFKGQKKCKHCGEPIAYCDCSPEDYEDEEEDETKKRRSLGEAKELSAPDKHRKKIAMSTLKMSDAGAKVMGEMTKEEARSFLKEIGYSDKQISKMEEAKTPKASLFLCNECAKTFRANENKCPTCGKEAESVIKEEKKLKDEKEEELPVEKPEKDETASAQAKVKVEGQEKLAQEVKADEGGEVEDKDIKNESKENPLTPKTNIVTKAAKEAGIPIKKIKPKETKHEDFKGLPEPGNFAGLSKTDKKKVDEQSVGVSEVPSQSKSKDPSKRTIVAKGLADKYEAERIASSKKGSVVSDDEDPKKFMVVVKEAKINEAENGYSVEADLDVTFSRYVPDWDIEHPRKVDVYFNIEEEHRSWGIKDISIYVTKPVNVSFVLVKWGENEDERFEKEITIPSDDIEYEWDDSAGIFSIPSFQVSVNEKGEVEAAVAYCGYWKP